jgi:hypothetical protein
VASAIALTVSVLERISLVGRMEVALLLTSDESQNGIAFFDKTLLLIIGRFLTQSIFICNVQREVHIEYD